MGRIRINEGALLCPVPPVLVTCGTVENPNVMTAAWTGIINTKPPKTYVSIRPERYSYGLIKASGELVLNLTTESLVRAADFCGVRSGRDLNKFDACALTALPSATVSAPTLGESPLSMECKVREVIPMGSHDMFLLDVTAVTVREELLDENGKLALEKCGLTAYAHGNYYALGKKLGSFGFSVRKKKKHKGKTAGSAPKEAADKKDSARGDAPKSDGAAAEKSGTMAKKTGKTAEKSGKAEGKTGKAAGNPPKKAGKAKERSKKAGA